MVTCCKRPAWTVCLAFLWLLVAPGAYLTHIALWDLLPHLKDLPTNIATGFDETFKFAYLESDSLHVQTRAGDALRKCGVTANVSCYGGFPKFNTRVSAVSNTTREQATIRNSFEISLATVRKIANDKYFGVQDLSATADSLNKIIQGMDELNGTMECQKSTPIFCNIHAAAGSIVGGMSSVRNAINGFKDSDMVERWEDHQHFLVLLHGLPYTLVLALMCFTYFWIKGGVCCCCRGGTKAGTKALIPFVFFWLLSFAMYAVIFVIGFTVKFGGDQINVKSLNGNPTLEQTINHLQGEYPEFWNLVFANMEYGLDLLYKASLVFVLTCTMIGVYSCLECCCCPYRKPSEEGTLKSEY